MKLLSKYTWCTLTVQGWAKGEEYKNIQSQKLAQDMHIGLIKKQADHILKVRDSVEILH